MKDVNEDKIELANKIAKELGKAGFKAYFAGGCVRDMIMKRIPVDYDIATDATPEKVQKIFKKTVPVGVQYGVVLVILKGIPFEVSTFRKDGNYIDGRHPENVEFSKTAKEDVLRRDFTINGLLYDPIRKKVLDYVSGKKDIKDRIIRAIGEPEKRFKEDKLRLMRAIRFASRYKFVIEGKTKSAMNALSSEIVDVSVERIRDELGRIIRGENPGLGLQMLYDTGILRCIIPEIADMVGVEQPEQFHPEGDVFTHTKIMLDLLKKPSRVLAFAALLHDVGKPKTFSVKERIRFDGHVPVGARMADKICKRLKFSNKDREQIVLYVANHLKFMDVQKMRESKLKRFMQSETFIEELELHRVDCIASHGKLENWNFCNNKLNEYSSIELKPDPLVKGDDIIKLGYKPSPLFKEILDKVTDLQLENKINSKEEALTWVKENYKIRNKI